MFLRPKNSKKRLPLLAVRILNILSKELYIDGQLVAALRTQITVDPVAVLDHIAKILRDQRIETLLDNDSEPFIETKRSKDNEK